MEFTHLRAVVADDDPFIGTLVGGALRSFGFDARVTASPSEAWEQVDSRPPHLLVSDLDFGEQETGVDLLRRVHESYPSIGLVALTSYQDPQLAAQDAQLPPRTVFQVKSALRSMDSLRSAASTALGGSALETTPAPPPAFAVYTVTAAQAEVLRMLAQGQSVKAIAEQRSTSTRAAELMLRRLYETLELATGPEDNPRVAAVRMWHRGAVRLTR